MKKLLLACACLPALALAACAGAGATRIETHDVVVTRTERAVKPEQLPTPPAPIGARPDNTSSALDLMTAKFCEYVGYAKTADPLLQTAAGVPVTQRILEPICDGAGPKPAS